MPLPFPGRAFARAVALTAALCFSAAHAQVPERSIDEIKVEAQARAERGAYPMGGLDPADVRDALSRIKTRERDDWAAGFGAVAGKYMAQAQAAKTPAEAAANYKRAWRLYYFGQWPVPASPGKQQSYANALDAYAKYARTLDPPLEVVRIPFDTGHGMSEIVGYLRLPKSATGPVPLVLAISGLDSRKETVAETYDAVLKHGVGFFAVDSPGTGQAPVKVSPTSDRMFSAILDYLNKRPEVDSKRILTHGVSFGGYWATKIAITEEKRLIGAVAQSPPIDIFFSEKFTREGTLGNREYLFDLAPAFIAVVEGTKTIDDLARILPAMSLAKLGLLGRPMAPMLLVGGVKDTQVPIADLELLMRSGTAPKEEWLNPVGGHLGREARGWTDPVIYSKVILPWELRTIAQSREAK
ncbi:MAG TPA: alpha/beta hydrolase [Burkholderiales bacterium]|nr:alpha/beta hydrolase [Burkholderiales bacterium]